MDVKTQSKNEFLLEKWGELLNDPALPAIRDNRRKAVLAQILENTETSIKTDGGMAPRLLTEDAPVNNISGGNIDTYDPVLIALIRRSMPNLVAYDICGVQPMSGPTGLIFAMRSRYSTQTGGEAFYNEANTEFATKVAGSGNTTLGQAQNGTTVSGNAATYNFGQAMSTALLESLGGNTTHTFANMAFDIDKVQVTAGGRALQAAYSIELAQDLKAIHGLDAETELANILTGELLAEINREIVRTVVLTAKPGANNATVAGTFNLDVDSNGRWLVEKFKGLMFQLELEANQIAKETRRGKANIVLCSSNVASALNMAGLLDYTPALNSNTLQVDDTGNTFVGVLNGRFNVFIDPYAGDDYVVVGYKGQNPYDAGVFYCPYVPLQMVRAIDPDTFQPKIGFKTRYGVVANPFSRGATASDGTLVQNVNVYYRRFLVSNLI